MASQKKTNTTGTNSNDNGEGPRQKAQSGPPPTSITNADIFEKLTGTREGAPPDMWTTAEKRRLDEEQEQQDFPQAEDGSRSGSQQQQQQQQDDKEKGEENEEETANDEPSDILDRHNKAMATILSRFLNMVNAATDPPPQGAVIEHASLNRLAMRTETAALVNEIQGLYVLNREIKGLWLQGPLRKPGEGSAPQQANNAPQPQPQPQPQQAAGKMASETKAKMERSLEILKKLEELHVEEQVQKARAAVVAANGDGEKKGKGKEKEGEGEGEDEGDGEKKNGKDEVMGGNK
ncbi:hypothetical protein MGN70_011215 [Eutypa lata]|nr:hypothetical protein MGN70_011215 [Eutypa lata]